MASLLRVHQVLFLLSFSPLPLLCNILWSDGKFCLTNSLFPLLRRSKIRNNAPANPEMMRMIGKLKPRWSFTQISALVFSWKMAGRVERTTQIITINTEFQEIDAPVVVSWHSVPALMATTEGGVTSRKGPIKKPSTGMFITGDAILINQLVRDGVILQSLMQAMRCSLCCSTCRDHFTAFSARY